jgi:hypothetical protein
VRIVPDLDKLSSKQAKAEEVKDLVELIIHEVNKCLRDKESSLTPRMRVKAVAVACWVIKQSYMVDNHPSVGATFKNTFDDLDNGRGI